MSLSDLFGASLEAPVAAIRRYLICYAIAAAAAIGALIYGASAATRALEIALGPVEARAIMALALALIAVGGFVAPRLIAMASRRDDSNAQARVKAMSREEKIAMVLEALRFGFAMGSRKPASQGNDGRK